MVLSGHVAFLNTLTLRWPRSGPRSVLPDGASLFSIPFEARCARTSG